MIRIFTFGAIFVTYAIYTDQLQTCSVSSLDLEDENVLKLFASTILYCHGDTANTDVYHETAGGGLWSKGLLAKLFTDVHPHIRLKCSDVVVI